MYVPLSPFSRNEFWADVIHTPCIHNHVNSTTHSPKRSYEHSCWFCSIVFSTMLAPWPSVPCKGDCSSSFCWWRQTQGKCCPCCCKGKGRSKQEEASSRIPSFKTSRSNPNQEEEQEVCRGIIKDKQIILKTRISWCAAHTSTCPLIPSLAWVGSRRLFGLEFLRNIFYFRKSPFLTTVLSFQSETQLRFSSVRRRRLRTRCNCGKKYRQI